MHIVIMGCGRVGAALAHNLVKLEHSVAVVDMDKLAFRRLGDNFQGTCVVGMGFDQETLLAAGIEKAAAFAAVSSGDNSNIIAARVARETFGVHRVVARIYDPKRAEVYERLGIPTVATVPWTANRLLKNLLGSATTETWRDPSGAVAMLHVTPHDGWVGETVATFEDRTGARVALISRFGTGLVATESMLLQSGDTLHALTTDDGAQHLRDVAGAVPEGGQA